VAHLVGEGLGDKSVVNYVGLMKMVVASAVNDEGEELFPREHSVHLEYWGGRSFHRSEEERISGLDTTDVLHRRNSHAECGTCCRYRKPNASCDQQTGNGDYHRSAYNDGFRAVGRTSKNCWRSGC
jgi:hypothetical protein